MKRFVMLHGINHNMFGKRDPEQYGTATLAEIDEQMAGAGQGAGRRGGELSDQQRSRDVRAHSPGVQENVDGDRDQRGRVDALQLRRFAMRSRF